MRPRYSDPWHRHLQQLFGQKLSKSIRADELRSRASVAFCRWCCNRVFSSVYWVQEASTLVVYPSTDEELLAYQIPHYLVPVKQAA